jgi:hypothetical protein
MMAPNGPTTQADEKARRLAEQLLEIGRRGAALPDLDLRPADEILGYGEHGLLE